MDALKDKKLLLELVKNLTESVVDGQTLKTRPVPSKLSFHKNKYQSSSVQEIEVAPEVSSGEVNLSNANLTEKQVEHIIQDKIGWPKFSRVFMTSALNNDGLAEVKVTSQLSSK